MFKSLKVFAILIAFASSAHAVDGLIYKATPPTLTDGQEYRLQGDTNGNLKVTGTVTANTSGLALEAGGNLATVAGVQKPVTISGTLSNGTPVVQAWTQVSVNRTVHLTSSAVGRLIEFSVDGGTEYFTFTYDYTSATSLVVFVKVPITHIRITGTTSDTWSIL